MRGNTAKCDFLANGFSTMLGQETFLFKFVYFIIVLEATAYKKWAPTVQIPGYYNFLSATFNSAH